MLSILQVPQLLRNNILITLLLSKTNQQSQPPANQLLSFLLTTPKASVEPNSLPLHTEKTLVKKQNKLKMPTQHNNL